MKKLILSSLCMLMGLTSMSAQTALQNEILEVAHRTNNYFMTKYRDPTIDTFVKKNVPATSGPVPCITRD